VNEETHALGVASGAILHSVIMRRGGAAVAIRSLAKFCGLLRSRTALDVADSVVKRRWQRRKSGEGVV